MTTPDFKGLWPTHLMSVVLPGAEQANAVLAELVEAMDAERAQMTTDYLSGDLFAHPHPAMGWLKSCVERGVVDYARGTGVDYPVDFSIQAWANVNRFGDYHDLHNHPHSWLSGTYYIRVPQGEDAPPGREDRTPNAISFFDPRPQANMLAVRGDPQVDPEHRILPQAGQMLIWPAFLHHMVHVNLSHEARLSVSFNIVLRWKDDYLP
ncbi:MAG: hypothetical protein LJE62_16360 [Silicimonas sp.]|nr:hypothetical protein [Silicimonas sp.]